MLDPRQNILKSLCDEYNLDFDKLKKIKTKQNITTEDFLHEVKKFRRKKIWGQNLNKELFDLILSPRMPLDDNIYTWKKSAMEELLSNEIILSYILDNPNECIAQGSVLKLPNIGPEKSTSQEIIDKISDLYGIKASDISKIEILSDVTKEDFVKAIKSFKKRIPASFLYKDDQWLYDLFNPKGKMPEEERKIRVNQFFQDPVILSYLYRNPEKFNFSETGEMEFSKDEVDYEKLVYDAIKLASEGFTGDITIPFRTTDSFQLTGSEDRFTDHKYNKLRAEFFAQGIFIATGKGSQMTIDKISNFLKYKLYSSKNVKLKKQDGNVWPPKITEEIGEISSETNYLDPLQNNPMLKTIECGYNLFQSLEEHVNPGVIIFPHYTKNLIVKDSQGKSIIINPHYTMMFSILDEQGSPLVLFHMNTQETDLSKAYDQEIAKKFKDEMPSNKSLGQINSMNLCDIINTPHDLQVDDSNCGFYSLNFAKALCEALSDEDTMQTVRDHAKKYRDARTEEEKSAASNELKAIFQGDIIKSKLPMYYKEVEGKFEKKDQKEIDEYHQKLRIKVGNSYVKKSSKFLGGMGI